MPASLAPTALWCAFLLFLGTGCSERQNSGDNAGTPSPGAARDKWEARVRAEFMAAMRGRVTMEGSTWTFSQNRLGDLLFGGKGCHRVEVRNVGLTVAPDALTEADRLNGVQWRGQLSLTGQPYRSTLIANQDYVPSPGTQPQSASDVFGGLVLVPTNRVLITDAVPADWVQRDFFGGLNGLGPHFHAEVRGNAVTWARSGPEGMGLVPLGRPTNRLEALLLDFEK